MIDIMSKIVKLSALFHDLGKGTTGFQDKLARYLDGSDKYRPMNDSIRHELVSYIMLTGIESDADLLEIFSDRESVRAFFSEKSANSLSFVFKKAKNDINKRLKQSAEDQNNPLERHKVQLHRATIEKKVRRKAWLESPLLTSVLWLVLTHHKSVLPKDIAKSSTDPDDIFLMQDNQLLINQGEILRLESFLTLSDESQPWDDAEWVDMVIDTVRHIAIASQALNTTDLTRNMPKSSPWIDCLSLLGRNALVFADHIESAESHPTEVKEDAVYANTREAEGTKTWADRLEKHLKRVALKSSEIFEFMNGYEDHYYKRLPSIDQSEYPKHLLSNSTQGPSKFRWQGIILKELDQWTTDNPRMKTEPFFGCLISRTGSGKTRMGPAIIASLSKQLRFTLGLGRRTLTVQSYNAYREEAVGFTNDDLALLIGETPPWIKSEIEGDMDSPTGTDNVQNMASSSFMMSTSSNETLESPLATVFHKEKEQDLLSKPISIMTIDHLVKSTYLEKSSDLKLHFHIQGSDIVLDEIDDYSEDDLIVLSKLIYLYGFYGRKVLLASATLPEAQVMSLYSAYQAGLQSRDGIYGTKTSVNVAFFNDLDPYVSMHHYEDNSSDISSDYSAFTQLVSLALSKEVKKHKSILLSMPEKIEDLHDSLLGHCYTMHDANADIIVDGIRVSVGFVRFNNVKPCQNFAIYLSEKEPSDFNFKSLCYHAGMTSIDRFHIESTLDRLLNRKKIISEGIALPFDPLISHQEVINAIEDTKSKGLKDLVIIVSTTSIQETGRDNDYDWVIVEPLSSRSLVQSSGRVWRHRDKMPQEGQFNVGILERPIRFYDSFPVLFGWPGIETTDSMNRDSVPYMLTSTPSAEAQGYLRLAGISFDASSKSVRYSQAEEILSKSFFQVGIDAAPCLKAPERYEDHPVEAMTIARIMASCKDEFAENFPHKRTRTINSFLKRSDTKLNALHGRKNRFRSSDSNQIDLYAQSFNGDAYAKVWTRQGHRWDDKSDIEVHPMSFDCKNLLIENIDTRDKLISLCEEFGLDIKNKQNLSEIAALLKVSCRALKNGNSYRYHPMIGLLS